MQKTLLSDIAKCSTFNIEPELNLGFFSTAVENLIAMKNKAKKNYKLPDCRFKADV